MATSDGLGFVPDGFEPPLRWQFEDWALVPLGPEHNASDFRAWSTSIDHIRSSPGYAGGTWPHEMTMEENLADLEEHAAGFVARREFTYTVLDRGGEVVGCVYVLPDLESPAPDAAKLRCWVRADHAERDGLLRSTVAAWLRADWPFSSVRVLDEV